jgi:hypothetical protein
MPCRPLVPLLGTLVLAALPACVLADCPPSTLLYGGLDPSTPIAVPAAALDTSFEIHPCGDQAHARFQVDAGLLLASTYAGCGVDAGQGPAGLETILEDDFTVTGPPAGTPVAFDAVLELDGIAEPLGIPGGGSGGRLRGLVHESATNEIVLERATTSSDAIGIAEAIALTVNAVAGTPVRLRFAVRGEALEGRAELLGTFRFEGLPAGATIVSCRGYDSSAPVPARAASWGRLKSLYR